MPFERTSLGGAAADDIATGSITPRPAKDAALTPGQVSPFSPKIDDEDWRRARAALATALDPQGNGGQVRWENAESGHKGSFGSIGNPYLIKDEICRTFVATVALHEPEQWFQGSACRLSVSEWQIRDVKPWKRPG